jgi:glycosyltransferase involved in cell wall biosynthesis
MKILIATSTYPPDPGGPSIHAEAQYKWFIKQGIPADVIILSHFKRWPFLVRHLLFLKALLEVASKYNLIYAYDCLGAGFPAYIVAKILGKKFVIRIGGDVVWERKSEQGDTHLSLNEWYEKSYHRHNWLYRISKKVMLGADAIIVPSPILAQLYRRHYSVPTQKIIIVENPAPEVEFKDWPQEKTIVFASRLVAYKNLDTVIKVLSRVLPEFPNVKFMVMGDGPERDNLEALVRKLNMSDRVIFTGSVSQEEVMVKTASSLFAIAPALTEFNPNYILQAVSFKKPFIMSRENGLPFQVPDELLFDPKSEVELEGRLRSMLSERGYERALEIVQAIRELGNWEDVLNANHKVFESVLNKS